MNFKELSFPSNIRLCVYHLERDNLDFHRHSHIADIAYCAAGELLLELPQFDVARVFQPGQLVQVPRNAIHRVSHCASTVDMSSYVLLQLGTFSINFVHRSAFMDRSAGSTKIPGQMDHHQPRCYIGPYGVRLRQIALQLQARQPRELSDTEYIDVLAALAVINACGIAAPPEQDCIMTQLTQDRA